MASVWYPNLLPSTNGHSSGQFLFVIQAEATTISLLLLFLAVFPKRRLLMRWMHPPRRHDLQTTKQIFIVPKPYENQRRDQHVEDGHELTPGAHGSSRRARFACVSYPFA